MTKITLWIPAAESPRWPCVNSWISTIITAPKDVQMSFVRSGANNIRYSWNQIVRDFLKTDNDYLWSCHNDVVLPDGALQRLLSWNKPLVSGLIFHRQSPVLPHIWRGYEGQQGIHAQRVKDTYDWLMNHFDDLKFGPMVIEPRPDDALEEVGFTSTSCTLIHRSVLEAIPDPWFVWDDDYKGGGEDRRFCELAKQAGFPMFVDRSLILGHLIGDVPTTAPDFIVWTEASAFFNTGEPEMFISKEQFEERFK